MFAVLLALFLALPFIEVWVAIQVAEEIGAGFTLMLLAGMSFSGVLLLRSQGTSVWRRANVEIAAGRPPAPPMVDGALVLVGGVLLMVPGFVTGVVGALLMIPPVRAVVRPLLVAWMRRRAERLARSGRFRAVVVDSTIDGEGRVRSRRTDVGEVIDSEGWEADDEPGSLPPTAGPRRPDDGEPPRR